MSQLTFTDPRTSSTYSLPTNPNTENAVGKTRNIERTSNTGNVGATKQQGDDGSMVIDVSAQVVAGAEETALWQWYALCRSQTVYLTDWAGSQYEGQIISLMRQWQLGPRNGAQWAVYDLQFEVWRFISGPQASAGVNP